MWLWLIAIHVRFWALSMAFQWKKCVRLKMKIDGYRWWWVRKQRHATGLIESHTIPSIRPGRMSIRNRGRNWKNSIEHKAFYALALRSHTVWRQIYSDYSLVGTNLQFICAIRQPALLRVNATTGRDPFETVNENQTCAACTVWVCVGDCVANVPRYVVVTLLGE